MCPVAAFGAAKCRAFFLAFGRQSATQALSLLNLAPHLQEQLLDLPAADSGRAVIAERKLRQIVAELDWGVQRGMWEKVCRAAA